MNPFKVGDLIEHTTGVAGVWRVIDLKHTDSNYIWITPIEDTSQGDKAGKRYNSRWTWIKLSEITYNQKTLKRALGIEE